MINDKPLLGGKIQLIKRKNFLSKYQRRPTLNLIDMKRNEIPMTKNIQLRW